MTNTITFFDTYEELCELTGTHSRKELWDAGFGLDDWDFGFVSDEPWGEEYSPYYQTWLLLHCIGCSHVEFGGRHYYMAY